MHNGATRSVCSLPPCGGGLGGGVARLGAASPHCTTPTPNPSPQGGGESTELAARTDSISSENALLFVRPFCRSSIQQLIENDGAEGCSADAAQGEAAEFDREIAGGGDEACPDGEEVAGLRKIDPVLDPDAARRRSDQPEHHDRQSADHRARNGENQRAELRRKSEQDGEQRSNDEDQRGIDL